MARRNSSIGFMGMFGRSGDLRQLDAAFRAHDLHPALAPEGVKLAIVNLMKDHAGDEEPPAHAYPWVAGLFCYCVLGSGAFANANGPDKVAEAERRIEAALEAGEGFDADLILLAFHARMIQPEIVERFDISVGED